MKIFVLDTNVLLNDALAAFKFENNKVVIPAIVLEEVDTKKRFQDEIGVNARRFSRIIDDLRKKYPQQLSKGVKLDNGGILQVELNHVSFEKMKQNFDEKKNDNRILAVALNLQTEEEEKPVEERKEVVLVTNDILNGVKADTLGIKVEKYENDRLVDSLDSVHKGYHEIFVEPDLINTFYSEGEIDFEEVKDRVGVSYYVQDFFVLKDDYGSNSTAVGRLQMVSNKLKIKKLLLSDKEFIWGIRHKNLQQKMLFELLMDPTVELICITGQAGTGKTLLALAAALQQTEEMGMYKKVFAARPIVPVGKDIGFLPGEKEEKLRPWMQPIYDNLEFLFDKDKDKDKKQQNKEEKFNIDKIVSGLKLEIEALTYIRGRSIPKQFMLFDEFQNTTSGEAKTILTRIGEGSKIIIMGDPEQIDHPYLDSINNGLTYVIEKMKQEHNVGVIRLEKTERSTLAEKAARLL